MLLLGSCASPETAETPEDAFNNAANPQLSALLFAEGGGMLLGKSPYPSCRFLHYYEESGGADGVLCFKPECSHSDYSCSAYLYNTNLLGVYNGRIYWVGVDPLYGQRPGVSGELWLWSMALDSSDRRQVKSASFLAGKAVHRAYYYKGDLYVYCFDNEVAAGYPRNFARVYKTGLDDSEDDWTLICEKNVGTYSKLDNNFIYGNKLYIGAKTSFGGGRYGVKLFSCDLESGVINELLSREDLDRSVFGFSVDESERLRIVEIKSGSYPQVWGLDDGEYRLLYDYYDASDDGYHYAYCGAGIISSLSASKTFLSIG